MKKGSALLLVVIVAALLTSLAVFAVKIVYNECAGGTWRLQREAAFWLAEAGLEQAKVYMAQNAGWYTDLPHSPADDSNWIRKAAVGENWTLGGGRFKIVRETGKAQVYAAGFYGKASVVLRLKNWREI